ncbi:MAG: UDP-glucose/GDP-mannose dehydrogenase family protein [Thermotogae bacterium]|nr:UDP-glucose/GDP-mannose dehydrogenase family protein [Thermotogota bacterium]
MAKIGVIGTGYVGLVSAVGMAALGHEVVGMDKDESKIRKLRRGELPFYEEGLEDYLKDAMAKGLLRFTLSYEEALEGARYVFVAVNTPMDDDGSADLSQLLSASRSIARAMRDFAILIVRSTAPVGSLDAMVEVMRQEGKERGRDYELAYNPEFLREGTGIYDFLNPSRVVVGADDPRIAEEVMALYEGIKAPKLKTTIKNAQIIKYASNAFLAARVSFINEIAAICESLGADVWDVAEGMGLDPRIGRQYLRPGPGYGGPCLPKDLLALIRMSEEHGHFPSFLEAIHLKNEAQKRRVVWKVKEALGGVLTGKTVGVLGLTFKPNTDDVRNSIAIPLLTRMGRQGAKVKAYDPMGAESARRVLRDENISIHDDPYEALEGADVVLILTAWKDFAELDWERIRKAVRNPYIVDSVGVFRDSVPAGWRAWVVGKGEVAGVE